MSKAGSNAHARTIREDKKRFIFETCVAFGDLAFFLSHPLPAQRYVLRLL